MKDCNRMVNAFLFLSPLILMNSVAASANPLEKRAKFTVYTANESGSVSKIGFPDFKAVKTINTGGVAHNVQVAPGGKLLAVTVIASENMEHAHGKEMEMGGKKTPGHADQVVFYNTKTDAVVKKVKVGRHPAHVVFTPDGKLAVVSNTEDDTMSVIGMSNFKVLATIPTGKSPHGFRIDNSGKSAIVANMGEKSLSVIDLKDFKEKKRIKLDGTPVTTAISSDGKFVYASLNDSNELVRVELSSEKMTRTKVGNGPAQIYLSSDDKVIYVANQGTKELPFTTVSKVNAQTLEIEATIDAGKGPHGVVTSRDGLLTFVTNAFDNTVSVIDNSANKEIQKISVGNTPNGISILE